MVTPYFKPIGFQKLPAKLRIEVDLQLGRDRLKFGRGPYILSLCTSLGVGT